MDKAQPQWPEVTQQWWTCCKHCHYDHGEHTEPCRDCQAATGGNT